MPTVRKIKTTDSSTTNMWVHLKNHHARQYTELESQKQDTNKKCKAPRKANQPTVKECLNRKQGYESDSRHWKLITENLTVMVAKLMLPFSIVEEPEFIEFVHSLDERYHPPSRKYLSNTAIPQKFNEIKEKVRKDVKEAKYVSVTSDAWSSATMESYLSLTCHFITPTWKLRSYCLRTIYMDTEHTGENIATMIREILKEYDLYMDNVVSITTDSGTNMIKACDTLKITRIPCYGHIQHNAVNNSTRQESVVAMVKSAKAIVSTFSHSGK